MSVEPVAVDSNLDARYGRAPTQRILNRRLFVVVTAVLATGLLGWLVWIGLGGAQPLIETRDIGHSIIDENSVSITFEASIPVGRTASCALESLNKSFTIVGWKVIDLPASDRYSRSFTEVVRTSEQSNTGLIYRCWLT